MPTHIEHVVTEIIPENEGNSEGDTGDKRWKEQMKIQSVMKRGDRHDKRLSAEAFDD